MQYLIVEDEYHAAKRLRQLVQAYDTEAVCLDVIDSVQDAVIWFDNNPAPDLTFFDIQLADGLSFSIFQKAEVSSPVIFTTAFDEYALRAFKTNSVDYLLKPVSEEELHRAMDKYKAIYSRQENQYSKDLIQKLSEHLTAKNYVKRFLIRQGTSMAYVNTDDVRRFESQNGLTYLVTSDGSRYNIDFTLEQVTDMIDPATFFRINRQLIAHIESVKKISNYFNSRLKLQLDPSYTSDAIVSRDKVKPFKAWITG